MSFEQEAMAAGRADATRSGRSGDDVVIRVEGLSKCYQIYDSPRDRLLQMLAGGHRRYFREFWAVRDVAFQVRKGETVGIIGRNGSGKSTLLQLICGTLAPSSGTVEVKGRVAALLELGAGFNPEFSGRENVYMNAALLGLPKAKIDERFEDIAAFADIGDFMDQPVKTYSSGMYVRLAFAVIANVDADVLVIDEALAVGDAIFVQKCMRFIRAFQQRGTLLFVSHDTGAVQNLCASAIWMDRGRVMLQGGSSEVAQSYLQYSLQEIYGDEVRLSTTSGGDQPQKPADAAGRSTDGVPDYGSRLVVSDNLASAKGWMTGKAEVLSVTIQRPDGTGEGVFAGGEKVRVIVRARANDDLGAPILGFLFRDRLGQDLFGENTLPFTSTHPRRVARGSEFVGEFDFTLPMLPNGEYAVMASVADGDLYDHVQHHYLHDALVIQVSSSKVRWGLVGIPFERISLEPAGVQAGCVPAASDRYNGENDG